jgi:hypothetical protein
MRSRALATSLAVLLLAPTGVVPVGAQTPEGPATSPTQLVRTRVALPAELLTGRLHAVIAGGPGFIAVGSTGAFDAPSALILISSPDAEPGREWVPIPVAGPAADGDLVDVTTFGGGYAAIGGTSAEATSVWLSPDGASWTAVASPVFMGTRPTAITAHDGGLFAVGCELSLAGDCQGSVAWSSPDGRTWDPVPLDLPVGWEVRDAVDLDGRLLLVGGVTFDEAPGAIAVTSDDGLTWNGQEVLPFAVLDAVAAAPDGSILAAGRVSGADGASGLLMGSADGGTTWQDTGLTGGVGSVFTGVSPGGEDTIVVGGSGPAFSETSPAAWAVDGSGALQAIADSDGSVAGTGITSAYAPFGTQRGGVAVGIEQSAEGERPAIWVLEPADEGPDVTPQPTTAPTAVPTRAPTPRVTPVPAANRAAEAYLAEGVSPEIRDSCEPKRDDLPPGTVAAILCEPGIPGIDRVGYYLMSLRDGDAVMRDRQRTYLGAQPRWGCDNGRPGRWIDAGFAGRAICYVDEEGRPNVRILQFADAWCHPDPVTLDGTVVRTPTVYVGVLGTTDIREAFFGWLGPRLSWQYPDGTTPPDDSGATGTVSCGQPWDTPEPTPGTAANTAAERYLLDGLPRRIRDTCEPHRDDLPDGTVAAILCRPDVEGVARVGFYLMSTTDAMATLEQRIDEYDVPDRFTWCQRDRPGRFGEAGWAGTGICYVDEEGRSNLRIVEDTGAWCHPDPLRVGGTTVRKPTVYTGVLGTTRLRDLFGAWAASSNWWAYPDGLRGPDDSGSVGGVTCQGIAPDRP